MVEKQKTLVLCENDFFDVYSQSSRWQPEKVREDIGVANESLSNIKLGDLVVHESFGIGLYRGPIQKSYSVGVREGVELEFRNNTRVFVSVEQLSLVHRYIGSGKKPELSVLGSKKWISDVKKAKESAKVVVYEVFALYSEKTKKRGFIYEKENDLDGLLASSFSFFRNTRPKKSFPRCF